MLIGSYNCSGSNRSSAFLHDFIDSTKMQILCLQETWLLDSNIEKLGTLSDQYQYTGKSGIDAGETILPGRPPGGVAVLWRKALGHRVHIINVNNRRICAIRFEINNMHILVVCVYLPCDRQSNTNIHPDYPSCINCLEELFSTYDSDDIIVCGDWNTCINR